MRKLFIAISLISLSSMLANLSCEARGGGHGGGGHMAAAAPVFYANGSAANPGRGPQPSGSNGYAYRPVGAGYWGRRGGRGYGGYGFNNAAYNDGGYHPTYKPVDNSFDEWNRAEIKHLASLPTSAFVKNYHWAPSPQAPSQVAAKNNLPTH